MSSPFYRIKLDIQHLKRAFHVYCHAGDTPLVRAYLYQDGEKYVPEGDWTAQMGYGEDFEQSTALVIVDGISATADNSSSSSSSETETGDDADRNYFYFQFTAADIATPGDYWCQVIIKNALDTERYVFGDGTLHVLESPLGGSHTDLVLTDVVNWDNITNTGTVPWPDSTAVVACSSCASDTTTCAYTDHGKTWVWTGACDQTFTLPTPTAARLGSTYQFLNLTTHIVTVRCPSGYTLDTYPAIYSGKGGVNTNPARTYIRVKQTTDDSYNVLEGRLTWTYLDT